MRVLKCTELDEICLTVVENSRELPLLSSYLRFLYDTGCRPSEPLNPKCFVAYTSGHLIMQPLKGNNIRMIEISLVPPSIFSVSNGNKSIMIQKDYETALDRFKKYKPLSLTMTNVKKSELYLFRYNYVRQLNLDGLSVSDIAKHMGWKNEGIVNRYLTTNIFVN